jgi:quinol monooxygenase YgiN
LTRRVRDGAAAKGEAATISREVREMAETPWQSYCSAATELDCVALLSYLPLNSAWSLPRLVLYSTRIQRQLRTSSGLLGYSLRARLAAKQFWTLSAWEDEAALQAFVAAPPHVAVMKAMAPYMGATRFVRWYVKGSKLPLRWDDALSPRLIPTAAAVTLNKPKGQR